LFVTQYFVKGRLVMYMTYILRYVLCKIATYELGIFGLPVNNSYITYFTKVKI